jgi:CO/xanthine dehydrogenase Mo-binding subunit
MSWAVGQNVPRVDGSQKVTGRALYTGDIKLPGMLHAKVLRSPLPHARIIRIDTTRAETFVGVAAVLTGKTLKAPSPYLGTLIKDQPALAIDKVRYTGDVVAAVAAEDEQAAEEAVRRIEVDYQELPAVFTIEEALAVHSPLVHDGSNARRAPTVGPGCSYFAPEKSNVCHQFRYERGNVEDGFAASDLVLEDAFLFPSAHHAAMEPHLSIAQLDGETLTIWSAAQSPFAVRQEICRIFGLPEHRIRVVIPYVGGGFGGQKSRATAVIAAALALETRRPVRVVFSPEECFKTVCQPRMKVIVKTGVKHDGTFLARQCQVYLNTGAYAGNSPSVTNKAGYRAHGPYRIPHVLTDAYDVYTNTVPAGSFRGFGAPQVSFAYESHLDRIAERLNMDAVELRLKNLLEQGEEYAPGDTPLDCDIKSGLKELARAIGWGQPNGSIGPDGRRRGKGIACAMKDAGGTAKIADAMVKILRDGTTEIFSASVELGQGVQTAFCQIVARELSVPVDRVRFRVIDTQLTPFDTGTHSSSATSIMGRALLQAVRHALAQLLSVAASLLGVEAEALALSNGRVVSGAASLTFEQVISQGLSADQTEIVGRGTFGVARSETAPLGYPSPFWEIGIGAAEVEVDEESGQIAILRYLSLSDAGVVIHPLHCRGQDEGSVLFGIGQTFGEELVYRDGHLANGSLAAYRLPRFKDLPELLETGVLEHRGGPGPYGAKGVGEAALLPVAPAVCNAVHKATGLRLHEVPLTPERVWRAVTDRENIR